MKRKIKQPSSTKDIKVGDVLMYIGDWNGVSGLGKGELVRYLGRELSFIRDENGDPQKLRGRWKDKFANSKKYFEVWVNVRSLLQDEDGDFLEQKVLLSHLAYPPKPKK